MLRTHNNGELRDTDIDAQVELCGWNHSRRDHGGVIFIDLRDKYGLTQVVFDPSHSVDAHKVAEHLSREDVLQVKGQVRARGEGLENPNLDTGKIEIIVDDVTILNKAETPPIEISDEKEAGEDLRLKYRYLDLRRPLMQGRLMKRHVAAQAAREYLSNNGFMEVTTPTLVKSTPEGARDYVVPSRVNPGKFYALPQSPQLYKQILMVSGCDRYFQLATCLRDEDLRADRQPEHMQIDIEMSFVELSDLHSTFEGLYQHIFKKTIGHDLKLPFMKLSYKESMDKYGTDKPDLRYDLELVNVTDAVKGSEFGVFNTVIENGGIIKCVISPQDVSRKELDRYIDFATKHGAKGLAWMRVTENGLESNIVKFFSDEIQKKILESTGAKPGSVLMFIADKEKKANDVLSRLRIQLAKDLNLIDDSKFCFLWVTDFPLFEWNEDDEKWEPAHHMFCMPKAEWVDKIKSNPGEVLCTQYDLVLNGMELGSGSIRITDPQIQRDVMSVVGFSEEEAEEKFGFLLEAFKYGAPPHGGIGIGFDRTVALMCGTHDIREVIAFPKNKNAQCPMDGSPSTIIDVQMKELHIKSDVVKKSEKKEE